MENTTSPDTVKQTMDLFVGIDIGTSGVRAVCVDSALTQKAMASTEFDAMPGKRTDPGTWARAVTAVLAEIIESVEAQSIRAIAVDGTSGTMIVTDDKSEPLSEALMYNDTCDDGEILSLIEEYAPITSAVHGATSGLAKAISLSRVHKGTRIQHEADWIASGLSGQCGLSDENNALKTGYDPVSQTWPDWIDATGMDRKLLPLVLRAGQPIGEAKGWLARQSGLPEKVIVVAGTTDGCASFLATGASEPGDGVSVLGSTMTIKLLSQSPIYAPRYGIYSHRIGDIWLAGGASNSGGKVLAHFFSQSELEELSSLIDTATGSNLDYYPLLEVGERFPVNDSSLAPRLQPRPASDTLFLQGMLEGISSIEKLAYTRLAELGGPSLKTLRTVGGGAHNDAWTQIRKNALNIPFHGCLSDQAATGVAVLARRGAIESRMNKQG